MTQTAHRERSAAAPEERLPGDGELVEVRGQSWVVARVEPAPPTSGRAATLVHLQSVADGRFGDTLSVIWEVEPGRRILDRGSLPDASTGQYDPPSRLAAFLDAVRWSAVASADVKTLQAPFRSGVAVEPYQLEPVSRAVGAPRVNLLLADDVGLGKTIEAGLVVQELLLRGRARRVMVICPAGLTLKWRDELAEKFGLDFTIVDAEHCARLRRTHGTAANPFRVHPLTIVSLPWLRGTKAQRLLDEVVPPRQEMKDDGTERRFFDLLVLDEAHHVAPAAPKQVYAVDSQQTKLIRRLVPHFEHRLFLSATPHNGYPESYTALLELIDNQKFARGVDPDEQARKETVVRRLKSTITNPDGSPRFRTRQDPRELPVEYTDTEREIHGVLSSFSDLRRRRMTPKARGGRRAADLVTLLLKKRLFSSPAAFLHTVQVYLSHLDDTRTRSRSAAAEVPEWLEDFPDLVAELDDLGLAEAEDDALTRSTSLTPQEDGEELTLLQQMERWALTHEAAADSKADALIRELKAICRPDGQFWTNERVVVFTEYRDTQKWLFNLLQQQELTDGGRVAILHGGLNTDDREQIRLGFQAHPASDEGKVRILLATDAASEGIDLQNHCHRLFNYDIPFNPNKLEQRIGRIDRWGQKKDPEITHFIGAGWEKAAAGSYEADLEFLSRIARKIARTQADLGSVNAVIADAVQRRMTGDTTPVDIDNAKPKQIAGRRTGGTVASEQNVTAQAKRLAEQYQETVDALGLTPANIKRVVDTALALDHQQPLTPHYSEDLEGLWTVPPLSGTWERATRGLAHKLRPAEQRPVTFDPGVAALGRDDVVLTHLKHPLVALSTRLLTAAVWNADTVGLHRVTAVVTDDPAVETALVSAYARYVLVGADGTRLHEEILYAGGWFGDTGRFRRWESVRTQGAVLARALTGGAEAAPDLRHAFTEAWPRLEKPLHDSLTARARERGTSLESALAARRTEEENRIRATLDRFEATLRAKLKEEGDEANEQIALFGTREVTTAEQRQYREDRDRWQARIEGLAAERERELAAIAARYHEPSSHLFPVAVVLVIPAKEASR
ncbi:MULTISPECIES: DISARM system SNF2-like helicase DrmD [Streptomyces]|uniref:DISARM system SNF2-like helicase DrmD n=1 Tax=Streptomyces TaxID=1883 RepID=UPI00225B084C|nr:DISARM system SNF2-like helicase DrmD [Streptomyces albidoflavus]WST13171.1 DISARM system SNF2-like helicase DrmD [Streptomyces microflavus]WTA93651.1 DISARM system SNF2-like helicase DrmD [Streptomyces cyaneofuscatus]MCX4438938.1 DISARM system SNF2-like helicase DrmD [Streptomyces albidoflavus]WSD43602.1 DISARM system SNF2-like helicase DrmD [Streptomyces albidoflavus]WTB79076.1 DISARM system SNF2-like helicase DrmD [Streptomyces albidoflavus]